MQKAEAITQGFRLSPQQEHLWLLQQSSPSAVYRALCVIQIIGPLDTPGLRHALERVVARHEILRTRFGLLPGMTIPLQIITDCTAVSLNEQDISDLASNEQDARIQRIFEEEAGLPVASDDGSPLRLWLVGLSPNKHNLILSLPALCADRVTMKNLAREIARCYAARQPGEELLNEPIQYADVAGWQNDLFETAESAVNPGRWREMDLSGVLTLEIPRDQRVGRKSEFASQRVTVMLDDKLWAEIEVLAVMRGFSIHVLLLACWKVLLYRLSGQSEIVVGTAFDGRNYGGLKEVLGPLSKYLPVVCKLNDATTFDEVLRQADESARNGEQWQETFSWKLIPKSSSTEKGAGYFPVAFDFEESSQFALDDSMFSIRRLDTCIAPFDLKLCCARHDENLMAELQYDAGLFSQIEIRRLADRFKTLIGNLVRQPEAAIGDLEILGPAERQELLIDINNTAADYPGHKCFHELFQDQAARAPDRIAVECDGGQLTYMTLNTRSNQLAHYLRKLGVASESRVAIALDRSPEMLVGILGVLKAGAAYVPLDLSYPKQRLRYVLEDAVPEVVLTTVKVAPALPDHSARSICLDSDWHLIAEESDGNPAGLAEPQNLAYVIYTSGSTGRPKGVMIPHGALVNYLSWAARAYRPELGAAVAVHSPIGFDLTVTSLFCPLLVGQTVLLLAEDQGFEALLDALRSGRDLGLTKLTPAHLELLSQCLKVEEAAGCTRAFVIGGEQLRSEVLNFWHEHAPASRLINEYGPTETVVGCCVYEVGAEARQSGAIPIGRPIANTRIYLLNSRLRPVPIGVPGELCIGGDGVARGYLNSPDLTAERFIPDPFAQWPGARLYKSGDLACHLSDGNIEFLGRNDEQVKIRGFRIELGDIQRVLEQHPAVQDAVLVASDDKHGFKRIVAYVVPEKQRWAGIGELRDDLREQLPDYMAPSVFVVLGEIPLTANGKVDRRALPAPDEDGGERVQNFAPPRTPVEQMLADIWAELLGVGQVGARDNFFELGGHSLLAMRLVSRVREAFVVEVALRNIFESPTISGLSLVVEDLIRAGSGLLLPPVQRAPRNRDLPMSFAQQRLWFLNQLEPDVPIYNDPACVRLIGRLNVRALLQTLDEILRRHEILRTTFSMKDEMPVQIISPAAPVPLPLIDLTEVSDGERQREVERLLPEETSRLFDLALGPVFRAMLVRIGEQEHLISLTMHHIVTDGWSNGVLVRELAALYRAYSEGKPSPLPELTLQYADFACWQRGWLQGEALEIQLEYWRRQLGGAPALVELPTDRPRQPVTSLRGAQQSFVLETDLCNALKSLARNEGATLFMTMLAAFQILLWRHSGQDDLCVGTPIAGRNRLETEGLIGFFVNTLVLRGDLSGDPSFRQLLERVREMTLAAYTHQDVPFERIVEELQPPRSTSYTPLFQVMFALENVPTSVLEAPGLIMMPVDGNRYSSKFDLTLYLHEIEQEVIGVLEYNTDLFDADTIALLHAQYRSLLENIVADPERNISGLSLSTQTNRDRLLMDFNEGLEPNSHLNV